MNLKKTFELGKVDYLGIGRKTCPITIDMELRNADTDKPELSICGDIWNHKRTDCYQCGQCIDTILKYFPHNKLVNELFVFWTNYHLNGMHAGTLAQEEALHNANLKNWANDYKHCCDYLESIGLLEDNGYKFGTGWLYQGMPEKDLNRIKALLQ